MSGTTNTEVSTDVGAKFNPGTVIPIPDYAIWNANETNPEGSSITCLNSRYIHGLAEKALWSGTAYLSVADSMPATFHIGVSWIPTPYLQTHYRWTTGLRTFVFHLNGKFQ